MTRETLHCADVHAVIEQIANKRAAQVMRRKMV